MTVCCIWGFVFWMCVCVCVCVRVEWDLVMTCSPTILRDSRKKKRSKSEGRGKCVLRVCHFLAERWHVSPFPSFCPHFSFQRSMDGQTHGSATCLGCDRPTDRPPNPPTGQPTNRPTNQPADRPIDRSIDRPISRPTDWPTDLWTSIPTDKGI